MYTETKTRSPHVLVVDDEVANILLFQALLEPRGFKVSFARDGEEALQRIEEIAPDIVLLDVVMPRMDGFEACERIKKNPQWQHLPVVLITGLDAIRDRVRGLELGADDFVTKPVVKEELVARVRSLVRTKRLQDQVLRYQRIQQELFQLSSLESASPQDVLDALARRTAELTGMERVVVTTIEGNAWGITADYRSSDLGAESFIDIIEEKVQSVLSAGKPVTDSAGMNYVGVPLRNSDGEIRGALHAFGGDTLPTSEHIQVLTIAGQRIFNELQLLEYNARLEREVRQQTRQLEEAMEDLRLLNLKLVQAGEDTMQRLAVAAEYRDNDTAEHIDRMSLYAVAISRELGWSPEEQRLMRLAAPMHDVGKIGIPDSILRKNGKLSEEEWEQMRSHPTIGGQLLSGSSSKLLQMAEQIALTHHEKYDGTGYPHGLQGEAIPMCGRIVALADVFDALTSKRCYKVAWTFDAGVKRIQDESGKHFDPKVVDAFLAALREIANIYENAHGATSTDQLPLLPDRF